MTPFPGYLSTGTRVHSMRESYHRPPGFYVSRCGGVIIPMNEGDRLVCGGDIDCKRCLKLMEGES